MSEDFIDVNIRKKSEMNESKYEVQLEDLYKGEPFEDETKEEKSDTGTEDCEINVDEIQKEIHESREELKEKVFLNEAETIK